ncbi:MAG: hypothetical protein AAGG80_01840 [Pseudomonadota bacterium]
MKTQSFKTYLEKRLNKQEIADIEKAAALELKYFRDLQADVSKALQDYMQEKNLGFNDIVNKLGKTPTQVSNILNGRANLTLASVAQVFALMKRKPRLYDPA